jgi:hypothetical protein
VQAIELTLCLAPTDSQEKMLTPSSAYIDGISSDHNPGGDGMAIFVGLGTPTMAPSLVRAKPL